MKGEVRCVRADSGFAAMEKFLLILIAESNDEDGRLWFPEENASIIMSAHPEDKPFGDTEYAATKNVIESLQQKGLIACQKQPPKT